MFDKKAGVKRDKIQISWVLVIMTIKIDNKSIQKEVYMN